jgi:superfamily II DNA or RNA helicase
MAEDFYIPALSVSTRYDRGVGFFSSGWLRVVAQGMTNFAANGGRARIITSPILAENDWIALSLGEEAKNDPKLRAQITRDIYELEATLDTDTLSALAWMVADEIMTFKLAVPDRKLAGGDFHDKFGIFTDAEGNQVSFNGSPNESIRGTQNYESNKIFKSWEAPFAPLVDSDVERFNNLWENKDPNLRIFDLPEAAKEQILRLRQKGRPYPRPEWIPQVKKDAPDNKWRHQDKAIEKFLRAERGILNMATGTGKTRVALRILTHLINKNLIDTIVIATDGNDLRDQWYEELIAYRKKSHRQFVYYRNYEAHKEVENFILRSKNALLLCSREISGRALEALTPSEGQRTLLIHDEVHGLGSPGNIKRLNGKSKQIRYRLGLSATPERVYDENGGNEFIEDHIGPVVEEFHLDDAIRRGILAPFQYFPIDYEPSDEDKQKIKKLIGAYNTSQKSSKPMTKKDLYNSLSRVYKTSKEKLPVFKTFIEKRPDLLERCIIFVETMEYGEDVLDIVHQYHPEFHSYFSGEDKDTLQRFATGELKCLVTCHRVSEGIDIKSLNNVILFSSSRARLETIQRIGRCLRSNPLNPTKVANIIDFIRPNKSSDDSNADHERLEWLNELASIRPEEHHVT